MWSPQHIVRTSAHFWELFWFSGIQWKPLMWGRIGKSSKEGGSSSHQADLWWAPAQSLLSFCHLTYCATGQTHLKTLAECKWKKAPASLLALMAYLEERCWLTQGLSELRQTTQSPWSWFPFPSCSCPSHLPHGFSGASGPLLWVGTLFLLPVYSPYHLETLSSLQAMDNFPHTSSDHWKYDVNWSKQTRALFISTFNDFLL